MAEKFKLAELKDKAAVRGLATSGTKAELIIRLQEHDPTGEWMRGSDEGEIDDDETGSDRGFNDTGNDEHGDAGNGERFGNRDDALSLRSLRRALADRERELELTRREREIEFMRREQELRQRELEIAQREIMALQRGGRSDAAEREPRSRETRGSDAAEGESRARETRGSVTEVSRTEETRERRGNMAERSSSLASMNLKTIAELVSEFDGTPDNFYVWQKQVNFMRVTYKLADDVAKTLVGMKLKKKAFEWLHSRAEHLSMTYDRLMDELERMYRPKQNKIDLRKKFEARVWKKGETFREYAHDKIIMGNRVPIDDDDMLGYLIEGIPDRALNNQARIQCFATKGALIDAFDEITLHEQQPTKQQDKRAAIPAKHTRGGKDAVGGKSDIGNDKKRTDQKTCFNCGAPGHVSAACPSKELGPKCFQCGEHGHTASKCSKKKETPKEVCAVMQTSRKKYAKKVTVMGRDINALIDTGSDLSLMCKDEYMKIGSPPLQPVKTRFEGWGSPAYSTLGKFQTEVSIDGLCFPISVHVYADGVPRHKFLIGSDFLEPRNFRGSGGTIYFDPDDETKEIPEVLQINVTDEKEATEIDLSHIEAENVRRQVASLIEGYKPHKTTKTTVSMRLVLKDNEAVYQKARRLSSSERDIVNTQIEEWRSQGIVQPSSSEYASPVVLTKKKDGTHRLCIDYRLLNKKIVRDRYPLPLIEDQLDRLQDARICSTLNLKNGFFHVPVEAESVKYTAFIVPDGQFEFLRVPFGLCNSPSVFQRYVNAIFRDVTRDGIVLIYMDDLIVLSNNYDDGITRLRTVLETASKADLNINWKKCCFLKRRVEFLGHIIEDGTVKPSERKIEAVKRFPEPKNIRQIQAFLGLTGYFRKFIPDYARIARPLSNLLRADVALNFGTAEKEAFELLKKHLSCQPVLSLYRAGAETELHTDASKHGYGAILLQRDENDGLLHPIYFASGKTTPTEEKYSSYELEVLAIIRALRRFRVYLLGVHFKIVTDCKAFTMTMNKRDLCVRVARWALLLEEFQYTIEHRSSQSMKHVDALSRYPLPTCLTIDEGEESLTARLRNAQRDDDDLKEKIEKAKEGKLDGYTMQRGLLYKNVGDEARLVVPRSMQLQIIRKAHERGHFAINKTETLVRNDYWIPGLREKTEKVIQNCLSCILAERRQGKQEGFLNPIEKGSVPLETFHMDHLGPLPSTKKSYIHILVVIDAFTKFTWLYGTKSTTSVEVIDRLRKQSHIFANPRRIISDRGTAFTSKEFESYCREEGIKHTLITTGIPRANGQVERVNRTLIPLLTKLSAPKPSEWYRYLDAAQRCLNTTPHRSTGTTPFRLMFGVDARLKDDLQIRELLNDELVASFDNEREELRHQAKENIQKVQTENKRNFNRHRKKAFRYHEGDIVAIRRTQFGPGSKFKPKFFGPYEIIKILRNDRYVVRRIGDGEGPKQTSTAADSLKPWINEDREDSFCSDEESEDVGHSGRMPGQNGRM